VKKFTIERLNATHVCVSYAECSIDRPEMIDKWRWTFIY